MSIEFKASKIFLLYFAILFINHVSFSDPYTLPERVLRSTEEHRNHTAISDFRVINRRHLAECGDLNPYLRVNVGSNRGLLPDDGYVTVNVTGILEISKHHWVGMISPSHSSVKTCLQNLLKYQQTGDLSILPLLCHYPVKAQYLSNDPGYLNCTKQECKKYVNGKCVVTTCGATLTFHVINIRTDIEFVLFDGGFMAPCILTRSGAVRFANPNMPLYGHLSSPDSTGTTMKITWVSGSKEPQQVRYGNGKTATSSVSTFSQADMCSNSVLESPAVDFGWHEPGFIHSAVMRDLNPSTSNYTYKYGSDMAGWSSEMTFKTPAAAGGWDHEVKFLAYGDMGKAPLDGSAEHYIQPGSVSVIKAMTKEVSSGNVDSIFHIGDISYATGFLAEWDYFLQLIHPLASKVSYMTAIGNHERDYVDSGSVYTTPDSGGECGVPYETYFPMPTQAKDKPWYSIEQGTVHFTVISTEHDWSVNSPQYEWMKKDMAAVNRTRTPWLIFTGHRPMYTSSPGSILPSVDTDFVAAVEPLLLAYKVDLALFGHVHNYERTCAVYQQECKAMPKYDGIGTYTYDNNKYTAPVHVVIGMAGFQLDGFKRNNDHNSWSLSRISEFGYIRVQAKKQELKVEFVKANSGKVGDRFRIIKQ